MGYRIVRRRFSEQRVRRCAFRILQGNVLCSMATVTAGGRSHINTAYFCYSTSLELYFLSAPYSLHAKNLANNHSLAMTVFDSSQTWGKPNRGIQLFGTCRQARGHEAQRAERLYAKRFRNYARWMAATGAAGKRAVDQLRSYRFYRFLPSRVKILDEREFGGAVFVVATIPRGRD